MKQVIVVLLALQASCAAAALSRPRAWHTPSPRHLAHPTPWHLAHPTPRHLAQPTPGHLTHLASAPPGDGSAFDAKCSADGGALWRETEQRQKASNGRILVWRCDEGQLCGGIGNQVRGIATAFYLATMTRRAFYVVWRHNGVDLTTLVAPNRIDWRRNPDSLSGCLTLPLIDGCGGGRPHCNDLEVLRNDRSACLILQSNGAPSTLWNDASFRKARDLSPLKRAIADPDFLMGCAAHFLFDFSNFKKALQPLRTGSPGGPVAASSPSQFVGVHLRLGDSHLRPGDTHGDLGTQLSEADKETTRKALRCAETLGETVCASGKCDAIFFASDSQLAKDFALEESRQLGIHVVESESAPMHSDQCYGSVCKDSTLNMWGDFLHFLDARGLVTTMSDYSQIPVQYSFMPFEHQRVVGGAGACRPLNRHDSDLVVFLETAAGKVSNS